jgi:hypothetical protein
LHFLKNKWCWICFHVPNFHLSIFFDEASVKIFYLVFKMNFWKIIEFWEFLLYSGYSLWSETIFDLQIFLLLYGLSLHYHKLFLLRNRSLKF